MLEFGNSFNVNDREEEALREVREVTIGWRKEGRGKQGVRKKTRSAEKVAKERECQAVRAARAAAC